MMYHFRSEHYDVSMFLAPLPDFSPAPIFIACSTEKRRAWYLFTHKHRVMDDYQNNMFWCLQVIWSPYEGHVTACDLNPYWLPSQIWYEFSSPLSRWPVSCEHWSPLRCHHITQNQPKVCGIWFHLVLFEFLHWLDHTFSRLTVQILVFVVQWFPSMWSLSGCAHWEEEGLGTLDHFAWTLLEFQ